MTNYGEQLRELEIMELVCLCVRVPESGNDLHNKWHETPFGIKSTFGRFRFELKSVLKAAANRIRASPLHTIVRCGIVSITINHLRIEGGRGQHDGVNTRRQKVNGVTYAQPGAAPIKSIQHTHTRTRKKNTLYATRAHTHADNSHEKRSRACAPNHFLLGLGCLSVIDEPFEEVLGKFSIRTSPWGHL